MLGAMPTTTADALALSTAPRPGAIAASLVGSEILKIAADVRALAADGPEPTELHR